MKKRNTKIEDLFTEAQSHEVAVLAKQGFALNAFYVSDSCLEMTRDTGHGWDHVYIYPNGKTEKLTGNEH